MLYWENYETEKCEIKLILIKIDHSELFVLERGDPAGRQNERSRIHLALRWLFISLCFCWLVVYFSLQADSKINAIFLIKNTQEVNFCAVKTNRRFVDPLMASDSRVRSSIRQ